MAGLFTCPILFEEYDDDPSSIVDKKSSHLPVQSSKCSHRVCYSCVMKSKLDAAIERNKDPCDVKWLPCPVCREMTSFNTERPIVDTMLCELMRGARRTSPSVSLDDARCDDDDDDGGGAREEIRANQGAVNVNAGIKQFMDGEQEESSVLFKQETDDEADEACDDGRIAVPRRQRVDGSVDTAVDIDASDERGRGNVGELVLTNDTLGSEEVTTGLRRSKRIIQQIISRDDESRFSAGEDEDLDEEKQDQNEGRASKRSKPPGIKSDILDESELVQSVLTPESEVFHRAKRLFRIREFVAAAKTPEDKLGVGPSRWCIKNNYCAASDRVLGDAKDEDEAMAYLRGANIDAIKSACMVSPLFRTNIKSLSTYCGSYKRFACMEKDDAVAMIVPGPGSGKGEAYFGTISSDKLVLMTPDEAYAADFPAMHLMLDPKYPFNGLMLREVQWLRKGYVRDLPGQKLGRNGNWTLPWLIESGPFWLLEASKNLNMMKSQSFMDSTVRL